MPADTLKALVSQRDREHAQRSRVEPERLILAPRTTGKRRICYDCRRPPSAEAFHVWWLAKHPLPKRFCLAGKWCSGQFKTRAEHRQWHERAYTEEHLPDMKHLPECPFCGGRLIEIS